jgi:hypothetical protein
VSHVVREIPKQFKVCDGCGEDIAENAVEGLHFLTIVVKARIPIDKGSEWLRARPIERFRAETEAGTTKVLHMHIFQDKGECKIKGKEFRTVIEAALKPGVL